MSDFELRHMGSEPTFSVTKLLLVAKRKPEEEYVMGRKTKKRGREMSIKMINGSPQLTTKPAKMTKFGCTGTHLEKIFQLSESLDERVISTEKTKQTNTNQLLTSRKTQSYTAKKKQS